MKVLMLFPYAPLPPPYDLSGTKRNLPFLLELVKYHEVSVLSFGTPEEERLFRQHYGSRVSEVRFVNRRRALAVNLLEMLWLAATGRSSFRRIYRESMQRALEEMVATEAYDIIHCCSHMFGFFQLPPRIPRSTDTHDVVYEQMRRTAATTRNWFWKGRFYWDYFCGKREELSICEKFSLIMAATEADRRIFARELPHQVTIAIPNGVPGEFFERRQTEPEPFTMVFTGLFSHVPNRDAARYFLRDIFPRILYLEPRARVYLVGKGPTRAMLAKAGDHVVVTGFVNDVRPYLSGAQVFINPLLAGTGIRTKALEAMAMRVPIVTTTTGVEGINLAPGESALFADTPDAFAAAVVRLFRDAELRRRIAENAFEIIRREHNWEIQGRRLEQALRSTVERFHEARPEAPRRWRAAAAETSKR